MKKSLLWVLVLVMSVSLIMVFSLGGCRPAVSPVEESVIEEPAEEPIEEEPAVEEPEEEAVVETEEEKEPRIVIDLEGNSNKRSQLFYLNGGTQALGYIVVGDMFPVCSIYVLEEGVDLMRDGGFPEVMVTENVEEVELTYMYKSAGNYYVEVDSANCNWRLRIVEE